MSDLSQKLENGHVYFSVNCIDKNLIYQQKAIILPKVQQPIIQELVNKLSASFATGIAKARAFLYGATCYQQSGAGALAMFMLQQAVETTFRTVAICLYGSERKTHSIRSLKRFNQRITPQLNDIFPGGADQEERLLQILEDAYLESRYNPEYVIEDQDLEIIFLRVSQMLELAKTFFAQWMQTVRNDY